MYVMVFQQLCFRTQNKIDKLKIQVAYNYLTVATTSSSAFTCTLYSYTCHRRDITRATHEGLCFSNSFCIKCNTLIFISKEYVS